MSITMAKIHIVGCGGLFYHSMLGIRNILCSSLEVMESIELVLWDDDKTDYRNRYRQWFDEDREKITLAAHVFNPLLGPCAVKVYGEKFPGAKVVKKDYMLEGKALGKKLLLIVGLPDNHKARKMVYSQAEVIADIAPSNMLVASMIAGNSTERGYCYSMWHSKGKKKEDYDYMRAHIDILAEADAEEAREASATSCMDNGTAEQSVIGNMRTGALIVETMMDILTYRGDKDPRGGREMSWVCNDKVNKVFDDKYQK